MRIDPFDPNRQLSPAKIDDLIRLAGGAPFTPDLLDADEPLWGGFWQFDVIAPGYTLPAGELALLRAVRLDGHWPADTTLVDFVASLQAAILHPKAGVWTLGLADTILVVFAAPPEPSLMTVVWASLPDGTLQAGYRCPPAAAHFARMTPQRHPGFQLDAPSNPAPGWLHQQTHPTGHHPAASLDQAIRKWRLGTTPTEYLYNPYHSDI
jgi:hypothetical protein